MRRQVREALAAFAWLAGLAALTALGCWLAVHP